jgi:XRE family aerobic/anaerobic benzoate catabolism transcriptional regulator
MRNGELTDQIGANVRAERARLGLTRKQLAAKAAVSERYLNELENGAANASLGVITRVATALGRSPLDLMRGFAVASHGRPEGPLAALLRSMSPAEQAALLPVATDWLTERRRRSKGIALLGLRGAGKTTLGRRLAERHGLQFVSITREVEVRTGMSLADLFNLGGPDAYRALENEVIGDLATREGRVVLETAGGIAANSEALEAILARYRTVWLKASPEEHLARVAGQGDIRPMSGNPRAIEHLKALLAAREGEYARAEFVVDTSGRSVEACLAELEAVAGLEVAGA